MFASRRRSQPQFLGSLNGGFFERRTPTGSGHFALFGSSCVEMFGQIVTIWVKTLININLVPSRHIEKEKGSLPIDVLCSKTLSLNSLLSGLSNGLLKSNYKCAPWRQCPGKRFWCLYRALGGEYRPFTTNIGWLEGVQFTTLFIVEWS